MGAAAPTAPTLTRTLALVLCVCVYCVNVRELYKHHRYQSIRRRGGAVAAAASIPGMLYLKLRRAAGEVVFQGENLDVELKVKDPLARLRTSPAIHTDPAISGHKVR